MLRLRLPCLPGAYRQADCKGNYADRLSTGVELHFDKLNATHFDKLNATHPMAGYALIEGFN